MRAALILILLNIFIIGEASGLELVKTGNPLDLSILGEGCYLKVSKGKQKKYLKSISMHFDGNREVVDRQGYRIGIRPPEQTTHIDITQNGRVSAYLNNDLAQKVKLEPVTIYKVLKQEKCNIIQGTLYTKN